MYTKVPEEITAFPIINLCALGQTVFELMRMRKGSLAEGVNAKTNASTVGNQPHDV